jgi:hypothetical protein
MARSESRDATRSRSRASPWRDGLRACPRMPTSRRVNAKPSGDLLPTTCALPILVKVLQNITRGDQVRHLLPELLDTEHLHPRLADRVLYRPSIHTRSQTVPKTEQHLCGVSRTTSGAWLRPEWRPVLLRPKTLGRGNGGHRPKQERIDGVFAADWHRSVSDRSWSARQRCSTGSTRSLPPPPAGR